MSDCRLTTFDNPYDPFEQFALWMLFDNTAGRPGKSWSPGSAQPIP